VLLNSNIAVNVDSTLKANDSIFKAKALDFCEEKLSSKKTKFSRNLKLVLISKICK